MTFLRLLPVVLLAACATQSTIQTSQDYARVGDYARAYDELEELYRAQSAGGGEVDPALVAALRQARMEYLYDLSQAKIFQEKEDEALIHLAELAAMASDYPGLSSLMARANHKKAMRMALRGDEALVRKDYALALGWYLDSRKVEPGLAAAEEGIDSVRKATERLSTRAQEQFLEAVRKLPEFRFIEVQWHAANVVHNAPNRTEAKQLRERASRANAQDAMDKGKENERAGQYGAALQEYKAARELDKALPGIDEAINGVTRELDALLLVDHAQRAMRNGEFDLAREHLGKAFELSVMARNDIGEMVAQTRKMEGERRYQQARDLEVLGKKAESLAAFEALAKDWPDGLSDEKARIDGLRVDIEGAAKEWAEAEAAEAAGDLPKALEHFQNSERFYAGWKDGKDRIAKLKAKIAAGGSGSGSGNGGG
jgi:hypothetical protein